MSSTAGHILVIDDDQSLLRLVRRWLEHGGFEVTTATEAREGRAVLGHTLPDAILLDLHLPDEDGLTALRAIKVRQPRIPVVMLTAESEVSTVVSAMQAGAWDYIPKPVQRTKLVTVLRNAVDKSAADLKLATLEREASGRGYPGILGESAVMRELFRQLDRVAPSDITVLVRGESGTGKELVARALHEASPRRGRPFVAINCAAIPENLQESQLFGHVKGAFTGAASARVGRFEQAQGGTLFLDEVGELSPTLQAKLLRVLQERSFYRVGGDAPIEVDVRIVGATHRDLRELASRGEFREDLYYRLAVFELMVPALRDRGGDLELLCQAFLTELGTRHGGRRLTLSSEALDLVRQHPWPGNVRELRNAMERAVVLADGDRVQPPDLPPGLGGMASALLPRPASSVVSLGFPAGAMAPTPPAASAVPSTLADVERQAIEDALERARGNVSEVSRALGIPRRTLYRRLKDYGLR